LVALSRSDKFARFRLTAHLGRSYIWRREKNKPSTHLSNFKVKYDSKSSSNSNFKFDMAAMTLVMDAFQYKEDTISIDWPIWIFRFENFLALSNIDITIPQQAANAVRHLLHSGGKKIMELYAAQGNLALTYAQFRAILDLRFILPANKLHVISLRNCRQEQEQSFDDYVTLLHRLAINAAVPLAQREIEVIHVIAQHASNEETRIKALAPDITLAQLKAWHGAQQAIAKCSKIMNSARRDSDTVNALKNETPKQCFNCGNNFPHQLGTTCPAIGKECNRCHKPNHFSKVCFKEPTNRPFGQTPKSANSNWNNRNHNRDRSRSNSRQRNYSEARSSSNYNNNDSSNNSSNKRRIRQVKEADLFERFKNFAGMNQSTSDSEQSSPEESIRRRSSKASKQDNE
jgi:hypothetical protein